MLEARLFHYNILTVPSCVIAKSNYTAHPGILRIYMFRHLVALIELNCGKPKIWKHIIAKLYCLFKNNNIFFFVRLMDKEMFAL